MGATNDFNRFVLPDNMTQDWLLTITSGAADAISYGDLLYDNGSDKCRPADKLTSLTTAALDQAQFAQKFIGISQAQVLAAESSTTKRIPVRVSGVVEMTCPSQTFSKGDLVGIYSTGSALDPQQVTVATHPALAIGVVTKAYTSATTRVRFAFFSRKSHDISSNWGPAPCLFDGQSIAAATTMTDAAQTLTVASGVFQKMVPTAARNITLPAEAQSKGLAFVIWNNSGGAFALNCKKSDGATAVDGTAAIPQGKIGILMCDGSTWWGFVSA